MTHVGQGHEATPGSPPGVPGMTAHGAMAGEVLAERYRLEQHLGDDVAGRQVWRGVDIVLRRPVALVLRYPGGDAASQMLTAAVTVSQVVHPHIASVYDAIDEGSRAYVVREWVPGVALRDALLSAPLDAERATMLTHAVAEAVSALHQAGIVHGNIHPGTVLIADDGRVVLADTRADPGSSLEGDVRAVGAILYAALTGRWPYLEMGRPSALPDAVRDSAGWLSSPGQTRAGIPEDLDALAADLTDPQITPPTADVLAAGLARMLSVNEEQYYDEGPIGFETVEPSEPRRRSGNKIAFGIAALVLIAVVGIFVSAQAFTPGDNSASGKPAATTGAPTSSDTPVSSPAPIAIRPDQVRIVDPPKGDRTELSGVANVVDGDESTGWHTDDYNSANFGGLKPGMGILIDLGSPMKVGTVNVVVNAPGASISLRSGTTDPGNTSAGDKQIATSYKLIGQAIEDHQGTRFVFPNDNSDQKLQYLLVWITKLPPSSAAGKFRIEVEEVTVQTP